MLIHYLKIAWRNLLKYKAQSVISIVGLSISFTAFTFTLSWIRYERGYDKHIPDAERIFRVFVKDSTKVDGIQPYAPNALAAYLKEKYPEIEAATGLYAYKTNIKQGDEIVLNQSACINIDTSFFAVFYPEIKISFPERIDKDYYIFSKSAANKLQLGAHDIGKRNDSLQLNLLDIIPDKPTHSNLPFDLIFINKPDDRFDLAWGYHSKFTYIRVKQGVEIEKLKDKLADITVKTDHPGGYYSVEKYHCKLVPLQELRTTHPDTEVAIRYHQLRLFAAVSLLVLFCAFFNYLMLFINKIGVRNRGLTLHKVNGASGMRLLALLLCEFVMLVSLALLVGMVLTEIIYPYFATFSMIESSRTFILRDALLFGISLLLLTLLFAFLPVRYFMNKSIQENLMPLKESRRGVNDRFTRMSIFLQLFITVLLLFSTTVLAYQFNYLNSNQIGFNRYHINTLITYPNEIPIDALRKIPGVEDVIPHGGDFLPKSTSRQIHVKRGNSNDFHNFYKFGIVGPEFVNFFDIEIIAGRNIHEGERNGYLINQTANHLLFAEDSTGLKMINDLPVVGVIRDMYIDSPLVPVFPSVYGILESDSWDQGSDRTYFYAYKYVKGTRNETEKEISKLVTEDIGNPPPTLLNMEELYAGYTKSERYLLNLLGIITLVSILISIFGVYSIVTLACKRRRKEIAIRKVNGATVREILHLFLRDYLLITLLACMVAFPAAVLVMQRWLEQYTRRVSMEWWLFVGIFVLVVLIVLASILSRVIRAANQNPAEVIKSE